MAACVLVTLPLELFLGARVYRRPVRLVRVLLPVVVVFVIWDALGIARGHWSYSERYTTGWELPFAIPLEELVFFVVVPLCSLLTYGAVRHLLATRRLAPWFGDRTRAGAHARTRARGGDDA